MTVSRTPATSGASGAACSSRAPAKYKADVGPGTFAIYRLMCVAAARLAHTTPNRARLEGSATISSVALVQRAAQRPGPEHRVHLARSAPPTAKPSSRRSRSARSLRGLPGASNATRRAACLTDCCVITLPYRHRSVIDTGLSLGPKPLRRVERSSPMISRCFTYPPAESKSAV